jgi:hypothetical protein
MLKQVVLLVGLCVLANNGKAQRNIGAIKLSKGVYIDSGVLKTEKGYFFWILQKKEGRLLLKTKKELMCIS